MRWCVAKELHIGLVEQDDGLSRDASKEPLDVGRRLNGSRRIMRSAHHHDAAFAAASAMASRSW